MLRKTKQTKTKSVTMFLVIRQGKTSDHWYGGVFCKDMFMKHLWKVLSAIGKPL